MILDDWKAIIYNICKNYNELIIIVEYNIDE